MMVYLFWLDHLAPNDEMLEGFKNRIGTVCPRSLDPFHMVSYYIKGVNTSWTYNKNKLSRAAQTCALPKMYFAAF